MKLKRIRPKNLRQLLIVYYNTYIWRRLGSPPGTKIKPGITAIAKALNISRGKAYDLLVAIDVIRSIFVWAEVQGVEARARELEREAIFGSPVQITEEDYRELLDRVGSCFQDVAMLIGVGETSKLQQVDFNEIRKKIGLLRDEVLEYKGMMSTHQFAEILDEIAYQFT